MECLEKVINSVCSIGEISDYGKKKIREAFQLTAGTVEKLTHTKKKLL